jgi:hypothetical protein
MKTVKALLMVCMVFAIFTACKSSGGAAPEIRLESTARVEIIEHKGTALGINTIPPWLSEYSQRNGVRSVEALPEFKNMYVVVGEASGSGLQQVQTWANNFDAQQQIGATISTRVASVFKAHENLLPGAVDAQRKYDNALNSLVIAQYTGARKENDWWVHTRTTERGSNRQTDTRYTAYVLYTIERSFLDAQIRNKIAQLKDDTPELTAAFDAISLQLVENGLEWE